MKPYIVLDLETSGLYPGADKILQIGWRAVHENGAVVSSETIVTPGPVKVTERITEINGLTQEMVDAGAPIAGVLRHFLIVSAGLSIVGHNILRFDWPFMKEALKEARMLEELDPDTNSRLIDTAAMFKAWKLGLVRQPGQSHLDYAFGVLEYRVKGLKYNLETACDELGIPTEGRRFHSIRDDVELTGQVFEKLLDLGVEV